MFSFNSCKKMKIPIFHMGSRNRCFDQRVPEETNRKIADVVSDINLTYSDISREYLISEGFPPDTGITIKTGSPIKEVINDNISQINNSKILDKLKLNKFKYFYRCIERKMLIVKILDPLLIF